MNPPVSPPPPPPPTPPPYMPGMPTTIQNQAPVEGATFVQAQSAVIGAKEIVVHVLCHAQSPNGILKVDWSFRPTDANEWYNGFGYQLQENPFQLHDQFSLLGGNEVTGPYMRFHYLVPPGVQFANIKIVETTQAWSVWITTR